jgi:hypothetical protein
MSLTSTDKRMLIEAEKIQRGDKLVASPDLRRRWGYEGKERNGAWKQLLWKLKTGRHPSAQLLQPVLYNNRGPVFRVEDVVQVEEGMKTWYGKDRAERQQIDRPARRS